MQEDEGKEPGSPVRRDLARWERGKPANLEAAACDAEEWLGILHKVFLNRENTKRLGKALEALTSELGKCPMFLQRDGRISHVRTEDTVERLEPYVSEFDVPTDPP